MEGTSEQSGSIPDEASLTSATQPLVLDHDEAPLQDSSSVTHPGKPAQDCFLHQHKMPKDRVRNFILVSGISSLVDSFIHIIFITSL